jgi:hypothetical protein
MGAIEILVNFQHPTTCAEVPKLPLELVPDAWVVSEQLQQATWVAMV